jgi:hypothetical protein
LERPLDCAELIVRRVDHTHLGVGRQQPRKPSAKQGLIVSDQHLGLYVNSADLWSRHGTGGIDTAWDPRQASKSVVGAVFPQPNGLRKLKHYPIRSLPNPRAMS